jgi:hypothetical protein
MASFLEKKRAGSLLHLTYDCLDRREAQQSKVFCFFFQKRRPSFLACMPRPGALGISRIFTLAG